MASNTTTADRPNIFPALRYQDASAAIDWLVRAFGFERDAVFQDPDGGIGHAQLRLGTGVVGLSTAYPPDGENPWTRVRQGLYVCVADVDAHHNRAKTAGADIVSPLHDTNYGSRDFSARDDGGHLWGFGTYDMASVTGNPTCFPELRYPDGAAAIEFLRAAFGFALSLEVPGPGGTVRHAELRFRGGVIMLTSAVDPAIWGDDTQALNMFVPDPDAHFARAKSAGARIVQALADAPYGARGYVVRDLEGFLWNFSTYQPAPLTQTNAPAGAEK